MQEGFALHEIICNKEGKPVDYRFLDVNKAFEKMTNLKCEAIRYKTVLEILPETEAYWIDQYGQVALSGEALHFENYSKEMEKYFSVNVFSPEKGKFITLVTDITSQVLARESVAREKNILERILEDTLAGYWDWDLTNNTIYLSPGFKKMFGYTDLELPNSSETWKKLIYAEDLSEMLDCLQRHIDSLGEIPFYNEVRCKHKDGRMIWVICAGHIVEPDQNTVLRISGCHIDITKRKQLEKFLEEERGLLKTTLLSIGDGVISVDETGKVNMMNPIAEKLTGWTHKDAYGRPFEEVFNMIDEYTGEKCENLVRRLLQTGQNMDHMSNTFLISKDGTQIPIENSLALIKDNEGTIEGAVLVFRDFTEKKEKQEKIQYLSFHDQLTGLYNRRFFEEELVRLKEERNLPLTLVMLDVNGLKLINDAFGHLIGDKVLQKAAQIMKEACRESDIIARIGGDEFVILLPKTNAIDVELIMRHIALAASREKIESLHLSISCGWATKETLDESMDDIFKVAEDRMYRQKLSESKSMRYKTIDTIIKTLHHKTLREKQQAERVSEYCAAIATSMNLGKSDISEIKNAALMHDIGKIAIDLDILNKPGTLNIAERKEVERHSEIGYQILRSVNEFTRLAEYVLAHHERWDGTGYPRGLKGEEIPLGARIISVADAYDAMTSERPYRKTLSKKEAIEELKQNAGSQFDPKIVETFILQQET